MACKITKTVIRDTVVMVTIITTIIILIAAPVIVATESFTAAMDVGCPADWPRRTLFLRGLLFMKLMLDGLQHKN